MNGICNDGGEININVPVESSCPSRWFYWKKSTASWVIDSSMSVRCPGKLFGTLLLLNHTFTSFKFYEYRFR